MNTRALSITLILTLAIGATGAQTLDEKKPYRRACVTVVDSETKSERPLTTELKPAAPYAVIAHLEASLACEVIVAAFSKNDGTLANGWLPVVARLEAGEEQSAPPADEPWVCLQIGNQFEVFVVFLSRNNPLAGKTLGLLTKLREGKADLAAQQLQARQLREELRRWAASDSVLAARPENAPVPIAASVRGWGIKPKPFSWQDYARKVNFSGEKPGVIIYRRGGP